MARQRADYDSSSGPGPHINVFRDTNTKIAHINNAHDVPDFRIAIDFGTTFTTIAFTKRNEIQSDVLTIEEFPGDRCVGRNGTQVPTEIWYSSSNMSNTAKVATKVATEAPSVLYGYEVTRRLELPESDPLRAHYQESGIVTKPKLLLDDNTHLGGLRKNLKEVL
jgi:hypothetical protein